MAQKKLTRLVAVGGGTAMAVGLLAFGWNWDCETRSALAYRRRELEPWEREM